MWCSLCGTLVAGIRGLITVSAWLIMVEYPSRAAIITALITPALNYITHSELCPAPTPQQSFMFTVSKFELSNSSISVAQHKSRSVICTCALVVWIFQWLFLLVTCQYVATSDVMSESLNHSLKRFIQKHWIIQKWYTTSVYCLETCSSCLCFVCVVFFLFIYFFVREHRVWVSNSNSYSLTKWSE